MGELNTYRIKTSKVIKNPTAKRLQAQILPHNSDRLSTKFTKAEPIKKLNKQAAKDCLLKIYITQLLAADFTAFTAAAPELPVSLINRSITPAVASAHNLRWSAVNSTTFIFSET